MPEYIKEQELIKLLDVLREKNISIKVIQNLCKVRKLLDLTMQQYNLLLYLISTRGN